MSRHEPAEEEGEKREGGRRREENQTVHHMVHGDSVAGLLDQVFAK